MSVSLAPDDLVRTHEQGRANKREPLLVIDPLLDFLSAHGLEAPDELTAEPIGDGHSNVTFALSTGVVLRRPPRGPLPPSAHDVLREARLLQALEPTDVRTPTILAVCDDEQVIGAPFYVMELVEGEVITDSVPAALDDDGQRRRIADELVDGLVELHDADWERLGLDGFGKPTGYLERQLRRFGGLWEHNRTRDLPEVAAGRRAGWPTICRNHRRPRSSTVTTAWATRSTVRPRRPTWRRFSTGRWPRSAIRWPTSGT